VTRKGLKLWSPDLVHIVNLEALHYGCDLGSLRSKVKVAGVESVWMTKRKEIGRVQLTELESIWALVSGL